MNGPSAHSARGAWESKKGRSPKTLAKILTTPHSCPRTHNQPAQRRRRLARQASLLFLLRGLGCVSSSPPKQSEVSRSYASRAAPRDPSPSPAPRASFSAGPKCPSARSTAGMARRPCRRAGLLRRSASTRFVACRRRRLRARAAVAARSPAWPLARARARHRPPRVPLAARPLQEMKLLGEYGLRCKREIWRAQVRGAPCAVCGAAAGCAAGALPLRRSPPASLRPLFVAPPRCAAGAGQDARGGAASADAGREGPDAPL